MAVPNTNTFTMRDVCNEIGVSYSGRSLTSLFQLATGTFDPNYVGSKNSLYNFRNYTHSLPTPRAIELFQFSTSSANYRTCLFMTPNGNRVFMINPNNNDLLSYELPTPFSVESIVGTTRITKKSEFGGSPLHINFSENGLHMYYTKGDGNGANGVWQYSLNTAFRPDLGATYIRRWQYSGDAGERAYRFFISNNGSKAVVIIQNVQTDAYHVNQGELSTPYNISTMSVTKGNAGSFDVGSSFRDNLLFRSLRALGSGSTDLYIDLRTYPQNWNVLSSYTINGEYVLNEQGDSKLEIPPNSEVYGISYPTFGDDVYILVVDRQAGSSNHYLYRIRILGNGIL